MNQPASHCYGWVDNLVQIGELLDEGTSVQGDIGNCAPPESIAQADGGWSPHAEESLGLEDEINGDQPVGVDQPGDPYQGTVEEFPGAAAILSRQPNTFLKHFDQDRFSQEHRTNIYYPFAYPADWEVGLWLTHSRLSMTAMDSLLTLELVSLGLYIYISSIFGIDR